jgi:hypothetical protein
MQCLETKGSTISTYLITSYFTPPLASMDTNSLNTSVSSLLISSISLASHHFLFYPYHFHLITSYHSSISSLLITSYFTPPLASMDKKITHYHLVAWHQWNRFPPFLTDPREFYPCPTYFSIILDLSWSDTYDIYIKARNHRIKCNELRKH